jgi:hypothetical protein
MPSRFACETIAVMVEAEIKLVDAIEQWQASGEVATPSAAQIPATKVSGVECAPGGRQYQAADLTVCRTW